MKTVLCISSQTVAGVIGGGVASFILQTMGHRVWGVPTSLNSNHGGHPHALREPVSDETVEGLIANLDANGWLKACDAVLTGHFSSVGQILAAEKWITRLKAENPEMIYCCDPVMGDDAPPEYDPTSGGLYVAEEIAEAIADRLMPLADIASPNRFELEYLTGLPCTSVTEATSAAATLAPTTILATSIPEADGLANLACGPMQALHRRTELLSGVPKGTGDAFIALFLGHHLAGQTLETCLDATVDTLFQICTESAENQSDELQMVNNRQLFQTLPAVNL